MSGPTVVAELVKNKRERVRVALDQWQGHDLVDIRVTAPLGDASDIFAPTKKGVSLAVARLPELIAALTAAEAEARARGLIGGDE
jgi:hypothetical protein